VRRVLVTGSAGFIGAAVRAELVSRGDVPVPFDAPLDVRHRPTVEAATAEVDAVINLAGRLGTSETFGAERDAADVNITGALVVADACYRWGVPMVQIGTGHKGQPNPYAVTKGCAEDLLLGRVGNTGQPVAVVRAFHAYGPGQKAFPPHGPGHVRKIMPSFICRALTGMPLEINGSGGNVIDLVYVDDVARVLVDAIDGPYGTVIEAGTGVGMRVLDVAREVIHLCRSSSTIEHLPVRDGEPDGAVVVARDPLCADHPFPFGWAETVEHYRRLVAS